VDVGDDSDGGNGGSGDSTHLRRVQGMEDRPKV